MFILLTVACSSNSTHRKQCFVSVEQLVGERVIIGTLYVHCLYCNILVSSTPVYSKWPLSVRVFRKKCRMHFPRLRSMKDIIFVHVWDTLETSVLTADLHSLDQPNTRRRAEENRKFQQFISHE